MCCRSEHIEGIIITIKWTPNYPNLWATWGVGITEPRPLPRTWEARQISEAPQCWNRQNKVNELLPKRRGKRVTKWQQNGWLGSVWGCGMGRSPGPALPGMGWQGKHRLLAAEGMMTRDRKEVDGCRIKCSCSVPFWHKGQSHLFPNQSRSQITV